MGSWNETCGLSTLPIKDGDEVVLFLLEPTREKLTGGTGFTSSQDFYSPVAIPVYGKYNDYGAIEEIEKNDEIVFNMILQKYGRHLEELPIEKVPKNIEELIKLIERDDFLHLSFVMFHRKIYENVLKEIGERSPYGKTETVKETYITLAKECIEKNNEIQKELQNEVKEMTKKEKEKYLLRKEYINTRKLEDFNAFSRKFTAYGNEFHNWYQALLDEPQDREYLEELVNFILIIIAMEEGRKTWMPQTGTGSQSSEMRIQETIADSIKEHIVSYKQAQRDEYEEFNEDGEEDMIRETIWIR